MVVVVVVIFVVVVSVVGGTNGTMAWTGMTKEDASASRGNMVVVGDKGPRQT